MKTEEESVALSFKLDKWLGEQDLSRIEAVILLEIAQIRAYDKIPTLGKL